MNLRKIERHKIYKLQNRFITRRYSLVQYSQVWKEDDWERREEYTEEGMGNDDQLQLLSKIFSSKKHKGHQIVIIKCKF